MDPVERGDDRYTCRLYIGGVPLGSKTPEVRELFAKYGEILDVFVNRNFAFVQFNDRETADAALKGENGTLFHGSRLDIQFAKKPKNELQDSGGGPQRMESSQNKRWAPYDKRDDHIDKTGPSKSYGQSLSQTNDWNDKFSVKDNSMRNSYDYKDPYNDYQGSRDYYDKPNSAMTSYNSLSRGYSDSSRNVSNTPINQGKGGFSSDYERRLNDTPYGSQYSSSYDRDSYGLSGSGGSSYRGGQSMYPVQPQRGIHPVSHAERTNDIEIVCQKPLRSYGEYIEAELKKSNFLVDVLFPEGGVSIEELLDNISSRGTLYAIVIKSYHQPANRLDLHVLHGVKKVLENTPVKSAVEYLVSNYADFNSKPNRRPRNILPEQVLLLLKRLVESQCFLNYTEYEILANYFNQQKLKLEPAIVPPPTTKVTPPLMAKETELTDRILNILNKKIAPGVSTAGMTDLLSGLTRPTGHL